MIESSKWMIIDYGVLFHLMHEEMHKHATEDPKKHDCLQKYMHSEESEIGDHHNQLLPIAVNENA